MTQRWGRIASLLAVVLALVAGGCATHTRPRATAGLLDLSGWSFSTEGAVSLQGTWQIYWHQLLTPQDLQGRHPPTPTGDISVPGAWGGTRIGNLVLPRFGYATLQLKVLLPPDAGSVDAIYLRYACTAYRLWVNGAPVAADGVVGTSRATETPQYLPHTTSSPRTAMWWTSSCGSPTSIIAAVA